MAGIKSIFLIAPLQYNLTSFKFVVTSSNFYVGCDDFSSFFFQEKLNLFGLFFLAVRFLFSFNLQFLSFVKRKTNSPIEQ